MSIPYMGSKRSSAGKIYQTIKNFNLDSNVLVDLFCGGFTISEFFYKKGWSVIANDKNKYVIELIKEVLKGLDEKKLTEFVCREKFIDVVNNPNKYEDWYVGYIMCCYSFGNNQKGYLFGKDVELYKKAGHELVINKNPDLILKLIPNFPIKYIEGIKSLNDWHKRRIALVKVFTKLKTCIFGLEQLDIQLFSCDYRDVVIPKDAIVYCDPPYQGTAEYKEGNFNHKEFWDWVREQSKTNKVYISEYTAPGDFKPILKFSRNSSLQGGQNTNQPDECLFVWSKSSL